MAFISSAYPLLTFTTREFVTTPVRGLAQVLKVSKPAITRARERLGALDLVRRRTDEADRRSVLVQRTVRGSVFLREFGETITAAARAVDRG